MRVPATPPVPAPGAFASAWPVVVLRSTVLAAALAISAACARAGSGEPVPPTLTVHVVSHGWHSGIIVPAALAAAHDWPARQEFPDADYFEVGWGDRTYYQATAPGWWLGLLALLRPSPGVLQVVALSGPPYAAFPGTPLLPVRLPPEGAHRLAAAIGASHARDPSGRAIALRPSLYGQGRFYASVERFHLFATCNVWVARRLRDAGLDLLPAFALTAGMLMRQLNAQTSGASSELAFLAHPELDLPRGPAQ
jgi:uncharacterized protein (TIGR02117 family)